MLTELLQKTSIFSILHRIDIDLAKKKQQDRCQYCGAPLHHGNYQRKPRGGPENIPDEYMVRQSLCCSNRDCRRRTKPSSCLFMGRRVYWRCVILVAMALRQNRPTGASAGKLMRMFDVSRKTLKRWFAYFRDEFPSSSQWQNLRGRVSPEVKNNELPGGLLDYFIRHSESGQKGLIGCLQFLANSHGDVHNHLK